MSSVTVELAIASLRALRAEYQLHLDAAYLRAEEATNGRLLNAKGRARGIDAVSLFMGNQARAYCYASPELVEHWDRYPRLTFAEFERQRLESW